MNNNRLLAAFIAIIACSVSFSKTVQPNILWVLTDDQRYDSIAAFNKIMRGSNESKLGYVLSPETDKLAAMGTTFINSYSQVQACAPSRTSMHTGRYPFHSGVYGFEYYNDKAEHCRPTIPQLLAKLCYQTFQVGKIDVRVRQANANGKAIKKDVYQNDINFRDLFFDNFTDWGKVNVDEIDGVKVPKNTQTEMFVRDDGKREYFGEATLKIDKLKGNNEKVDKKYDILRMSPNEKDRKFGKGEILGGVSSRSVGKTRDGWYAEAFMRFLSNPNMPMQIGRQSFRGVDPSKPLFAHIGFDFPHTPVLPPKSFRDKFNGKRYNVPVVDKDEYAKLPPQLQKLVDKFSSDHYPDADKQQMVRDYYAFCAYGDFLVGNVVKKFIDYSVENKQPWMVVYVCGDHGWKLNDHGAVAKFSPWEVDARNPVIVISSDKKTFTAGRVVENFSELVDLAPTFLAAAGANLNNMEYKHLDGFNLADVADGKIKRDYVVGENIHVIGNRATIRTKDYMFSIRSRPQKRTNDNMLWAMSADYKDLEPVFYDLKKDPNELNNLAFDKNYKGIIDKMKKKLLDIVIGNRIEVDWGKNALGTKIYKTDFAPNADDKVLKL